MKNHNSHPADKFCRNIVNEHPDSLNVADMFYRDKTIIIGEKPCPAWCALPSSFIASHIAGSSDKHDVMRVLNKPMVFDLTSALLWWRNKMIYRFDKTLADMLALQHLDGKIPFEAFDYLPYPCVFIERDMIFGDYDVGGFFAWLDWGTKENKRVLHLNFLRKDSTSMQTVIPISGGTIKESVAEMAKNKDKRAWGKFSLDDVLQSPVVKSLSECVNLLLYLCSEKPDMSDDIKLRVRRSRDSFGNPKRVVAWDVGIRIGAALRKTSVSIARSDNDNDDESAENNKPTTSKRPHMRRAHWHSYWTGKRDGTDRKLILRWLPPTAINLDSEESPTVITPVKDENKKAKQTTMS